MMSKTVMNLGIKFFFLSWIMLPLAWGQTNDDCINADVLTPATTCNYTPGTFSGSTFSGTLPTCASSSSQDVWYQFTATDPTMQVSVVPVGGVNVAIEIRQGGCNGTVVSCTNNFSGGSSETYLGNIFIPGQTYHVRVLNPSSIPTTGGFSICVQRFPTPVNDTCDDAQVLLPATTCNYTSGSFSGASLNGSAPTCASSSSQDVWYQFTATDPTMQVSVVPVSSLNVGFEIRQGGCNGTVINCTNNFSGGSSETFLGNVFIPGQTYHVRVLQTTSALTTGGFSICVQSFPTPANDTCDDAQVLTPSTTCNYISGTFSGASLNGSAPTCATSSSQDVWYQFTATDPTMQVSVVPVSSLNVGFEIRQGGCNGTVINCTNNFSGGSSETFLGNVFIPGQTYHVRVLQTTSALTTGGFSICVQRFSTPANDTCDDAQILTPSTTCNYISGTFSGASLNGSAPTCATSSSQDVWYQFTATDPTMLVSVNPVSSINVGFEIRQGGCNGTVLNCTNNFSGGNIENYLSNTFIPGQTYHVRVLQTTSALTTGGFSICVQSFPTPVNDTCNDAQVLTPSTTCNYISGTFSGASLNGSVPTCATSSSQDVWYQFTATDPTMLVSVNPVSSINVGFEIRQGGCNGTVINCTNNFSGGNIENYLSNTFIPGQTYHVRVLQTTSSLAGLGFSICVQSFPTPANDTCDDAIELIPGPTCSPVNGTFSGSSLNGSIPGCTGSASQDVWYRFTATGAGMGVTVSPLTSLNLGFEIFQGGCNGSVFQCVNNGSSGVTETFNSTSFVPGQTYYVRVFNVGATINTAGFTICVTGAAPTCTPTISISATGTTICQGTNVTFSAAVSNQGNAPIYQWRVNGNPVGSNSSTYTASNLVNGDLVTCQLTSNASCASPTQVTSNTVTMTVNAPVTPTFNAIAPICSGGTFSLPPNSLNGISGSWSPAINTTSTTTYTFTPDAGQCAISTTLTVTVNTPATPSFNQVSPICAGGIFTLPTTSLNTITGSWTPAVNNMATTTYTFTPDAGQCAGTTTMTVVVNNPATPAFTTPGPVCYGTAFSLPTTSLNNISGTWSPAFNDTATTTYTFTPAAGECATTATMTVTIQPPSAPQFAQIPPICSGDALTLPGASINGINGSWSPAVNNTATTTYTFTPSAGECALTTTLTVTVNPQAVPQFSSMGPFCSGTSFSLPDTSINGIIGTWSPPAQPNSTTTYTFTPAAGFCATLTSLTVSIQQVDTSVSVSGFTLQANASGSTYQWLDCNNGFNAVSGAVLQSFTPATEGAYAVQVSTNGCTDTSSCYTIFFSGVETPNHKTLVVFPNPTDGPVWLMTPSGMINYRILNATGQVLLTGILQSESTAADLTSLPAGIYFLQTTYDRPTIKIVRR